MLQALKMGAFLNDPTLALFSDTFQNQSQYFKG